MAPTIGMEIQMALTSGMDTTRLQKQMLAGFLVTSLSTPAATAPMADPTSKMMDTLAASEGLSPAAVEEGGGCANTCLRIHSFLPSIETVLI